ncbi:MAG: hypothetical protein U1A27_05510 [Phycisphaerae bacterium]
MIRLRASIILLRVAATLLIFNGAGHLIGHFVERPPAASDEERQLWQLFTTHAWEMFGQQRTLHDLQQGYSLSFSVFSFLAAGLSLAVASGSVSRTVLGAVTFWNAVCLSLLAAVMQRYMVLPPLVLLAGAAVCCWVSFVVLGREPRAGAAAQSRASGQPS